VRAAHALLPPLLLRVPPLLLHPLVELLPPVMLLLQLLPLPLHCSLLLPLLILELLLKLQQLLPPASLDCGGRFECDDFPGQRPPVRPPQSRTRLVAR
jgi:hypothetical protein